MASIAAQQPAVGSVCCHPEVSFNSAASILKDEDVLLIEHQRPWPTTNMGCDGAISENASMSGGSGRCSCCGAATDEYSLFAVFDGHNGVAAARQSADLLVGVIEERLPPGPPPPASAPGFLPWREDLQLALIESLAELNRSFALRGILAGCTATIVLQVGWLLTVANLGDSRAMLDTGRDVHLLTVDHRVASHKGERRRVEAMGNTIAPLNMFGSGPATREDNGVGPLRIWPGGLCLSRAIGDFDVGDAVIPFPHVMQVMAPPGGARLLLASDGVWDAYEKMSRVGPMLRGWSLDSAPQKLIQTIVRAYGGLRDDTTLAIIDMVPPGKSFPGCAMEAAQRHKAAAVAAGTSSGGGGFACGCFGAAPPPPPPPMEMDAGAAVAAAEAEAATKLEVLADVDVAAVMGLMPGDNPTVPGWYDEYVGEQLCALAAEAMEAWQDAHERRTGRRPATPPLESSVRAARAAREALGTGEAEPLVDGEGAAWAPAPPSGGGMRRSGSTFFAAAVADQGGDYADKFGHYKGFKPAESPTSGSPGSSTHRGSGAAAAIGAAAAGSSEGSVRCGGYRYGDTSVRAGSRFVSDASVRAGGRYAGPDASVRAGGRFVLDPSVRAGTAYFAGGAPGGAGGSGHGQPSGAQARPSFRPDPSIRSGVAFFSPARSAGRGASVSGAGAVGASPAPVPPAAPQQAAQQAAQREQRLPEVASSAEPAGQASREEKEEGRQHGRRGGGAAGAALAAAAATEHAARDGGALKSALASGGDAAAHALVSFPISVPRSVAFGGVTVLGGAGGGDSATELGLGKEAGGLRDSPVDHSSLLVQQSSEISAASCMTTIAEN